jgi:Zn ribbon nucleic-acid-binding protein
MPTAALIDLNHLAFKHLDKGFFYLQNQDYDSCTGSLHAVNAALPKEYQIIFDTIEYNNAIKHPLEILCKKCPASHNRDEIQTWNMILPLHEQIITKKQTVDAWTCPECGEINTLADSKFILKARQEPYFTKVVPMPPERKQNLGDRTAYHVKYRAWFNNVVAELTRQISQLRWDHWKQGEDDSLGMDDLQQILNNNLEDSI